jgi:hypothetical protein
MVRTILLASLALSAACGRRDPSPAGPVRDLPAVRDFAASHPDAVLARPEDNGNPLLAQMREQEPGYDPYILRQDITGDGRADLVVVLRKDGKWPVYWMRGTKDGYADPVSLGNHELLAEGGLVVKDGALGIGRFYSDVAAWYRWNPDTGALDLQDPALP